MAIIFSDNFEIQSGKPIDNKYFNSIGTVYSTTAEVNNTIDIAYRYEGLTVNVANEEYWYKNGITNLDLVEKLASSSPYTGGNGIDVSGTEISLGNLTANTSITGAYTLTYADRLLYATNLSGSYTDRTLVDKGYVDSVIPTVPTYTGGNGIDVTSNVVSLGNLTQNTSITGAYTLTYENRLLYASDISGSFTDHTLVTKKYVDDNIPSTTGKIIQLAISDETTDLTSGTGKITFRMPYAMTLTGVRASLTTAATGANLIVDINQGGSSILSTKLSIDATEKTSTTATTPAVISTSSLTDDAEIRIDIDQIGSTVAGAGLKITLIG